jgi:D-alanine-D-alanine ligase
MPPRGAGIASRRILILFTGDQALAHGRPEESLAVSAVRETAEAVHSACAANGWDGVLQEAPPDPAALLEKVRKVGPDLVFHLVESLEGEARFEAAVASLLDWLGVPYTGSPPPALALALEKPLARAVLGGRGVPVPRGCVLRHGEEPIRGLRPPWIVKPSREDASHGIGPDSVVQNESEARERARRIIAIYRQPALLEEFAPGREFNVSLLGEGEAVEALPVAEIDYSGFPADVPPLLTYRAKWETGSEEYQGSRVRHPEDLSPGLAGALVETARSAYGALGLRDYGRVDVRLSRRGTPVVVDVNANPDLSPDAGFAGAAARKGMSYADLIGRIVASALGRTHRVPGSPTR